MAPRLILPIGQDLGLRVGDDPAVDPSFRQVRCGATVAELSDREYLLWSFAHGSPEALAGQQPWDRDSVLRLASVAGVEDAASGVDELFDRQLLVEVSPGSPGAIDFAQRHRVIPRMLGLGNTAEDPLMFGIGFLNNPVLSVDYPTYDLWQWSAMDDSLWSTCESAADVARRAGSTNDAYLDPDKLLTEFLPVMHALLLSRAATLDVAFRLDRPDPVVSA